MCESRQTWRRVCYSDQLSGWGVNVITATLTAKRQPLLDGLVSVFLKLLISWDSHAQQSLEFYSQVGKLQWAQTSPQPASRRLNNIPWEHGLSEQFSWPCSSFYGPSSPSSTGYFQYDNEPRHKSEVIPPTCETSFGCISASFPNLQQLDLPRNLKGIPPAPRWIHARNNLGCSGDSPDYQVKAMSVLQTGRSLSVRKVNV